MKHKKKIISISSDESNEKTTSMKLDRKNIKLKPSLSKKKREHARLLVEKARLSTGKFKDSKKTKKKMLLTNTEVRNNILKKATKCNTTSVQSDQQNEFSSQQLSSLTLGILPTSIQQNVLSLKEKCSKVDLKEGKKKFFSPDINNVLLETELLVESKQIKGKSKNFLYNYISDFFPCSKETLVKRMKKLVTDQQEGQLVPLINKLKEAVDKDMIVQEKEYKDLCVNLQAKNGTKPNHPASFAIGSPENDNDLANSGTSLNEEKSKRKPYAPRRKFTWSKSTRAALCEVVVMKIKLVEQNRGRSTVKVAEYLKDFFENKLKDLWPKGWMQSRQLMKESKNAHQHLTAEKVKSKSDKPSVQNSNVLQKVGEQNGTNTKPLASKSSSNQHEIRQPINSDIQTLLNFLPPEKDIISSNQAQAPFCSLFNNSSMIYPNVNDNKSGISLAQSSQAVLHNNQINENFLRDVMLASNAESQLNLLQQQHLLLSNNPQLHITNPSLNLPNMLDASFSSSSSKNANNSVTIRSNTKHKDVNSLVAKKEVKNRAVLHSQPLPIEKARLNKTLNSAKNVNSTGQNKVHKVSLNNPQYSGNVTANSMVNNQQYHVKHITDDTNQNTDLKLNVSSNAFNEKNIVNNSQSLTSKQVKNNNIKTVKSVSSLNLTNPVTYNSKKATKINKKYQQNYEQKQITTGSFINPGLIGQQNFNPLDEYHLAQILNYSPNALANFSVPQIPNNLHHNMIKKGKVQSQPNTNINEAHRNKIITTKSKINTSSKKLLKQCTSSSSSPLKLENKSEFQMNSPLQSYPRVNSEPTKKLSHKLAQQRQNQQKMNSQPIKKAQKKPQLHEKLTQQKQKLENNLLNNELFPDKRFQGQQISALQFQQQPVNYIMSPSNQAKAIGSSLHNNSWQQKRPEKVSSAGNIPSSPFSLQNASLMNQNQIDSSIVNSLHHNNYPNSLEKTHYDFQSVQQLHQMLHNSSTSNGNSTNGCRK